MHHEKIFRRPNGLRIKVRVRLYANRGEATWCVEVWFCRPRKRTWETWSRDSYEYRAGDYAKRRRYAAKESLKIATQEEIDTVLQEAWQLTKPHPFSSDTDYGTNTFC